MLANPVRVVPRRPSQEFHTAVATRSGSCSVSARRAAARQLVPSMFDRRRSVTRAAAEPIGHQRGHLVAPGQITGGDGLVGLGGAPNRFGAVEPARGSSSAARSSTAKATATAIHFG
jgi:hypothetical protein